MVRTSAAMMALPRGLAGIAEVFAEQLATEDSLRRMLVLERILDVVRRQGALEADSVASCLGSGDPAKRIVGLTLAKAHHDGRVIPALLAVAREPLSEFELYHAIQALEAVTDGVNSEECVAVRRFLYEGLIEDRFQASVQALAREALTKLRRGLDERSLDLDVTHDATSLPPVDEASSLVLFLSHASEDKSRVRGLYDRLSRDGHSPWLDEEDLLPGQDFEVEIRDAIRKADAVLICLSRHTDKAGFLQREIKLALDFAEMQPPRSIFIIPVMLEKCELPDRLQKYHWAELFAENGYESLSKALRHQAAKRPERGQRRKSAADAAPGATRSGSVT